MNPPRARLRLLVHLYAQDLLSELEAVENAGPELGTAMGVAIMGLSGDPRRDEPLLDRALKELERLNAAIDAMRDAIFSASEDIDSRVAKAMGEDVNRIVRRSSGHT